MKNTNRIKRVFTGSLACGISAASLVCLLVPAAEAGAQNLSPTVVVTNSFQTKISEVHKPELPLNIPDSLNTFNLDFDYSVFDRPYRGSYDFSPYLLNMKPVQGDVRPRSFYLNAGAGYTLHPTFDLVWSPVLNRKMSLDLFAGHHSYIGKYQKIQPQKNSRDESVTDFRRAKDGKNRRLNHDGTGVDMDNSLGMNFRYDWDSVCFEAGAAYAGVFQKDFIGRHSYNEGNARVRVYSKTPRAKRFIYDVRAEYAFGADKSGALNSTAAPGFDRLTQHDFDFDAVLGAGLSDSSKVSFDFGFDLNGYSGAMSHITSDIFFVPHYILSRRGWRIDLGARLSGIVTSREETLNSQKKSQIIYPAVNISYNIRKLAMKFDLNVGGGETLDSYASLMRNCGHYYLAAPSIASRTLAAENRTLPLIDNTIERVNASLGLSGRVGNRFSYSVRAGYALVGNAPVDRVFIDTDGTALYLIKYMGYNKAYASLGLHFSLDWMRLSGAFGYVWTDIARKSGDERTDPATGVTSMNCEGAVAPAPFSGDVRATFNIRKRVFLGVDCEFATRRGFTLLDRSNSSSLTGSSVKISDSADAKLIKARIPGYADLGISAEYQYSRRLSFWLRGGNLLCMSVQRTPLYAERGLSFTAGICYGF